MNPIHQPSAGKLECGVGPTEGRKHQTDLDGVKMELGGQAGGGDGNVAAIEVVDDDRNEQQTHDAEPTAGWPPLGCNRVRLYEAGVLHPVSPCFVKGSVFRLTDSAMASILGLLSSETIDCGKSPSLARLASPRYEIETLGPVRRNNVSERRDAGQRVI